MPNAVENKTVVKGIKKRKEALKRTKSQTVPENEQIPNQSQSAKVTWMCVCECAHNTHVGQQLYGLFISEVVTRAEMYTAHRRPLRRTKQLLSGEEDGSLSLSLSLSCPALMAFVVISNWAFHSLHPPPPQPPHSPRSSFLDLEPTFGVPVRRKNRRQMCRCVCVWYMALNFVGKGA